MEALAGIFARVDKWNKRREPGTAEVQAGSRSALDDAATDPYHLTHSVEVFLSHSLDHLHALQSMISNAHVIHLVAPFTLMRAALENAAAATWLLLPDEREERIRRRPLLAIADAKGGHTVRQLTEAVAPEPFEQRRDRLVPIGTAQGLTRQELMGAMPGWRTIVREAGTALARGPDFTEAMWRMCSGFTHGRLWSMLAVLEREQVTEVGDVASIKVTAPASAVYVVAKLAADMYETADRLHSSHRLSFKQHQRRG